MAGYDFPDGVSPDLAVRLEWAAGGREKRSGYRANLVFDGGRLGTTGWFKFENGSAQPGETVGAEIALMAPQLVEHGVDAGASFKITEGRETVASGHVTRILALAINARRNRKLENE